GGRTKARHSCTSAGPAPTISVPEPPPRLRGPEDQPNVTRLDRFAPFESGILVPGQPRLGQVPEKHADPGCCQQPTLALLRIPPQVDAGVLLPVVKNGGPLVVPLVRDHHHDREVTAQLSPPHAAPKVPLPERQEARVVRMAIEDRLRYPAL